MTFVTLRYPIATAVLAVLLTSSGSAAHAQEGTTARSDSLAAVEAGKKAAREPLVTAYFLGAVVAGPMAIGALIAGGSGAMTEHPEILAYPVPLMVLGGVASRTVALPDSIEASLAGESAAYSSSFRHAYARELKARRTKAIVLGTAASVLAGLLFLSQLDYT